MVVILNGVLAYQYFFTINPGMPLLVDFPSINFYIAKIAAESCQAVGDVLAAGGLVTYSTSFTIVSYDKYENRIYESTANFSVSVSKI
jgi:hypothetical protein